jgi:type IV pilus assembly protein PilZ
MSTEKKGPEGRGSLRIPIELRVEYKKMNTFFSDYTKNISKGGTFIKTEKPLKVGTEFLFKLSIPALSEPIDIRGQVVWVNTETNQQRPDVPDRGMGIKFIYEDTDSRKRFEGMVEKMMKDSLGDLVYHNLVGHRRGGSGA